MGEFLPKSETEEVGIINNLRREERNRQVDCLSVKIKEIAIHSFSSHKFVIIKNILDCRDIKKLIVWELSKFMIR